MAANKTLQALGLEF